MSDAKTLLGKRIRYLRVQKKHSQEKLGEMSQISGKYIGEIERGQANLTIDVVEKLSTALKVEMVDLFNYQQEMGKKRLKEEINSFVDGAGDEDLKRIFGVLKSMIK
jgi:transcriptional regulator with XRE-family HTH domain